MAGVFTDYAKLLRLFLVFHLIGDVFLIAFLKLSDVVKRFVKGRVIRVRIRVTLTLLHLWLRRKVWSSCTQHYKNLLTNNLIIIIIIIIIFIYIALFLRNFMIFPFLAGLISARKSCRKCGKALIVE